MINILLFYDVWLSWTRFKNIVAEQSFRYQITAINIIQFYLCPVLNCRSIWTPDQNSWAWSISMWLYQHPCFCCYCDTLSWLKAICMSILCLFHYGGSTQVYLSTYVNFEISKNDFKHFLSRTPINCSYTQSKILSHGLLLLLFSFFIYKQLEMFPVYLNFTRDFCACF